MKFVVSFFIVFIILVISVLFLPINQQNNSTKNNPKNVISNITPADKEVIAQNLDTPWGIAFLPDGNFLVSERVGTIRLIKNDGSKLSHIVATVNNVREISEGGLLGIAVHPDFKTNNYVYYYYTYGQSGGQTLNRVVRAELVNNSLGKEEIVVDAIPGAPNHNGGRIKFGPDKNLYITTGDAQDPSLAQSRNSLAGKILRVRDEGRVPPDNPFGNRIFSMGHRNSQGIAWDEKGNLWSSEHGRSFPRSGLDEINFIESGKNYGWEIIQGDESRSGLVSPVKHSGDDTWAPASAAIIGNKLFIGGLRGAALYEAQIDGNKITHFKEHFKNEFGRIREVIVGPDNMLYISTSNNDGRGRPKEGDDKIIRINPNML